jgi:integrase
MKSPTKRPPQAPTERPPPGLWYETRPGKAKPFLARWRRGGVKHQEAFVDERSRAAFAAAWAQARKAQGATVLITPPERRAVWDEFARITGGADPIEVARFWQRNHATLEGALPIEEARRRYEIAQAPRILARDTVTHRALHLDRFQKAFAGRPVGRITPTDIAEWLGSLAHPDTGEPVAAKSRAHHRANVGKLFAWAVVERLVDRNPVDAVPVPDEDAEDEVNILTVDQARQLFAANRDALCVGRLALEAFGGLRFSSAARLVSADISFPERGIILPATKHKSRKRQYLDGLPANLWAWLHHAHPAGFEVNPRLYLDYKRRMFEAAGLKGNGQEESMRNVLRHSFCTYHVAMDKDAARTAVLLTHRSPAMLYRYYRGRASEADGKAYFRIEP